MTAATNWTVVGAEIGQTMAAYRGLAAELFFYCPEQRWLKQILRGFIVWERAGQQTVPSRGNNHRGRWTHFRESVTPIVGPGEVLHLDRA